MTHICVSKLTIISSDNGLSPGRSQVIFWTNAGILLIGTLGTNFSEILIEIHAFSFKKMHLKMSSGKWRPLCLGLHVLRCGLSSGLSGSHYLETIYCLSPYWPNKEIKIKISVFFEKNLFQFILLGTGVFVMASLWWWFHANVFP